MEFFAITNHKLSEYKTVITATDSSDSENSFGNVLIKSMSKESHEWQFKVLNNYWSNGLYFGIAMDRHLDFKPAFTSNGFGYGLCSDGSVYSANSKGKHHKIIGSNFFSEKKKENANGPKQITKAVKTVKIKQKIIQNDIVCMTLDLKKRTLTFHINEQKNKIVINKIKVTKKTNYKMAVYAMGEDDAVQLLQYNNGNKKSDINNCCVGDMAEKENEQKEPQNAPQNEQKEAQKEQEEKEKNETENPIKKLENESSVAIETEMSESDKKIECLQNELTEIKIKSYQYLTENKELQTKLDGQRDEILKLEQDINGYKERMRELAELKVKNGALVEEQKQLIAKNEQLQIIIQQKEKTKMNVKIEKLDMLNMKNESLAEEQKALEMESQCLFVEYKKLKIESMDVSKYRSWDWFDIFVWIITIANGRFVKYEQDLHAILSEEQPTGQDLEYVNEADVKRWGVANFGDIHALRQSIQDMISKYSMFVFLDK